MASLTYKTTSSQAASLSAQTLVKELRLLIDTVPNVSNNLPTGINNQILQIISNF